MRRRGRGKREWEGGRRGRQGDWKNGKKRKSEWRGGWEGQGEEGG